MEVTDKPKSDLTWLQFLAFFSAAAAVNGAVRYAYGEVRLPTAELVMFYLGSMLGYLLFPAIIIIPLHLIGKKMATGMAAPRKMTLIWGCAFATVLLIRFVLQH